MKHYSTINDLVSESRKNINELNHIVDVLLSGYRTAAEVIDVNVDHRKHYIEQFKELNEYLSSFVDGHPALKVEKLSVDAFNKVRDIAERYSME